MDETNFDGQPSFTQQAGGPPAWTSADDLDFARSAGGLAQVKRDLRDKIIYPHDAAPLLAQYAQDMGEMSARKQAFDQHQQQQQMQASLGQNAMQRAVEHQNQLHAAAGFQDTTAEHFDANTGNRTPFYQESPGVWKPVPAKDSIDFGPLSRVDAGTAESPTPTPASDYGLDAGASFGPGMGDETNAGAAPEKSPMPQGRTPLGPDGQPLTDQPRFRTVVGPDGVQREQRIPTLAERQAADAAPGGAMSIQNGPYTDQYQDGRLVASNRPQPEQQSQEAQVAGTVSPSEHVAIRQQAERNLANLRPGPGRDRLVAAEVGHLTRQLASAKLAQANAGYKATAAEKAVQGRKDLQEKKQDADLTAKQLDDLHTKRYGELSKELNRVRKQRADAAKNGTEPEPLPDWAKDEDTMDAEAWRRADRAHKKAYPHRQEGQAAAQPPASNTAGGNTPGAAQPLAAKDGQQKAFDSLMQQVAAPRPTPPPAKPTTPPFNTETYRKTRVSKFE